MGVYRLARLKDIAELAGVSVRSVSNVVNNHPYVTPAMRERVQAAIDELGYRPNLAARQLRRGRTGMVVLAVPDLMVPYFAELAGHVMRATDLAGLTLLVEQTGGDRAREAALVNGSQSQVTDGLILSPLAADADDLIGGPSSPPMVLLGERVYDPRFDHVSIDNAAAAKVATLHLTKAGRRRVAAVGAHSRASSPMADLRLQGYLDALAESGLPADDRLIVRTEAFLRQDGYNATVDLLRSGAVPDAIFCFNDLLAQGALRALSEAGLSLPHDVAVVGIDDNDESRYTTPSLTSIQPDKAEIARRAVARLTAKINKTAAEPPFDLTVGFNLVVRESSP